VTSTRALAHRAADDRIPLLGVTIGELLRERARDHADRAALRWPSDDGIRDLTYAQLLSRAERLARALLERAEPGDRIAVWAHNSVEWVELEYACALAGLVLAPFNTAWVDAEVEHALALTRPRALFAATESRGSPLLERATRLAPDVVVRDIEAVRDLTPVGDTALPELGVEAPFLIQFTSGTTGSAKGALLSHRAALNSANQNVQVNGRDGDVWLNPVPLHHIGGSVHLVLGALCMAGTYTVMPRYDLDMLADLLVPTGATRTGGVPTILLGMLDHPRFQPRDVQLRVVGLGGTTVPAPLVERIEREFGAKVSIAYGQSECPAISNTAPDDPPEIKAETVGQPVSHSEVKIVSPTTGETLRRGEVGEVCVRSPMQMDEYIENPVATAATIDADGFLHTGDLASMDEAGILRIQGRSRDVIIRGGENIYPAEVEGALMRHDAVVHAAVVGFDDERWGQQVAAFVQLDEGSALSEAELTEFVSKHVAHFKVPRLWRFVSSFPLTASGKIRKVELEQQLAGETATRR
jgi:fatty-acyl-CoA synthase